MFTCTLMIAPPFLTIYRKKAKKLKWSRHPFNFFAFDLWTVNLAQLTATFRTFIIIHTKTTSPMIGLGCYRARIPATAPEPAPAEPKSE